MISVLVPTRGRPASVLRLLTSSFETAKTEVEFIFYIDSDDPTRDETINIVASHGGRIVHGGEERIVLSEMWNVCALVAEHDVMMHCGDDIVFRSDGWDEKVLATFEKFPDKIVFVHGRDGFQDANLGTHGFLHRNWVNAVGYFVPPYFSSDYNDLWLTEVAHELGRRVYLRDVYTEHMHPVAGKGEWDQTHQERLVRHKRDNVEKLYRDLADKRAEDVAKLRAAITAYAA